MLIFRQYYWWKGMRADVQRFCRGCLVCASRKGPGRPLRPPLTVIPVGGPFHRVGADVLQLPLTANARVFQLRNFIKLSLRTRSKRVTETT